MQSLESAETFLSFLSASRNQATDTSPLRILDLLPHTDLTFVVARLSELDETWNTSLFQFQQSSSLHGRIYFPVKGEGFVLVQDCCLHLRPGYLYMIPPFLHTRVSCPKHLTKYWTHFNANVMGTSLDLFNLGRSIYEVPVRNSLSVQYAFETLMRIQGNPDRVLHRLDNLERMEASAALTVLLMPFLQSMAVQNTILPDLRLIKLLFYIEHHLNRPLTLKELAAEVNLSPTYLSNLFTKQTGIPLVRYCNQRKIAHALHLLQYSHISIKEVAWQTGAENPLVFTRLFKRHIGITPQEYRARSGKSLSS